MKTLKALGPGRPLTEGEYGGGAPPPPGKNWIRFDFPVGATPEQIAKILMESLAKHPSPKGEDDDAYTRRDGTYVAPHTR